MSGIIQCPQCGAPSSTKISATEYHCTYCESNFTVGMSKEDMIASILAKAGVGTQQSASVKMSPEMLAEMRAKAALASKSAKKIGVIVLVSILLFVAGILSFVFFTVHKAVSGINDITTDAIANASITKFTVFNGSNGPAVWTLQEVSQSMHDNTHYVLTITDPASKKQLKQLDLIPAMTWEDAFNSSKYIGEFYTYGDTCWIISEQYGLTARDIYSGKMLVGPNQLSKMYTQFQTGISKVEWDYSHDCFSVITNDGFDYLFFPDQKKAVKKEDYENHKSEEAKGKVEKTFFILTEEKRPQLFISKEKSMPNDNSSGVYSNDLENFGKGSRPENPDVISLVKPLPDLIFFNGFMEYTGKDKMIIAYQNTVAKKSALHISCISADGKVLWNISGDDVKPFLNEFSDNNRAIQFVYSPKEAVMYTEYGDHDAIGVDWNTGKVLWTYTTAKKK
jgi:hypothetical protein